VAVTPNVAGASTNSRPIGNASRDAAGDSRNHSHPGALAGMRVLELAQIMAGPTCGMMLADMGADVIKVEKLPGGDDARGYREPQINGVSAPFLILNRNKRGIALNLKHPRGRDVLLRMVRRADVLTENYRRGTLEKLGLGYDVLAAENPGLIYCAVSGYGRDGPLGDKGGFDLIAQGFAGLMSITGEPGGPPAKDGNSVADINAGILAVVGVLAAYTHKLKTGQGQVVDTSLMEAALQQTYWHAAIYFANGQSPGPTGSAHLLTAPYQAFRASDGWINIGGANQANWERIADVLGHPEWRSDPRFVTNSDRMQHMTTLADAMNAVLATRTKAQWIEAFDAAGVPVGPVHTIGEALSHPQTLARGMVVDMIHPTAGPTKALGCPVHFSATPTSVTRPAPLLGEHTREMLREHGYDDCEIDELVAEGVVEEGMAAGAVAG
jgi:crotonobetainyl-CoA:carnitine CoA-transferase CaiB-like acyl-CoA transferase